MILVGSWKQTWFTMMERSTLILDSGRVIAFQLPLDARLIDRLYAECVPLSRALVSLAIDPTCISHHSPANECRQRSHATGNDRR